MSKLGDLVVNIGANTKPLNAALGRVRKQTRSMTSNFKAVGKDMSRNLTLPLALIGGAAVNLAVEFESAMAQVKAVSGATGSEFKKLEQSAKDLGASTVFTAREVAALQLEYSRLGFSADEIIQVQEATLNLAQATGSDLAQAAEVAGATLRAFGLDASETGKVTDIMAASFSASALNIDTFQDSMKFVAPIARAAGVSIEETSAMLAVLANSGIKGSQAGTALRRIMQEMQGTSGTLSERFAELAAKGIGLEGSMDEVGRRAATSLLVLTNGAGQVDELTGAFGNAEGAAKTMADVMNDSAKGALKEMQSALEGAGIALGDMLSPAIEKAADLIKGLANSFREASPITQGFIVAVAAIVAAIGPLLIILPTLAAGFSMLAPPIAVATSQVVAFAAAWALTPIGAITLTLGGLAGAVMLFGDNTNRAVEKNNEFIDSLKGLDKEAQIVSINNMKRALEEEKVLLEIAKRTAERNLRAGGGEVGVGAMSRRGGEFLKFGEDINEATTRIADFEQRLKDLEGPLKKVGGTGGAEGSGSGLAGVNTKLQDFLQSLNDIDVKPLETLEAAFLELSTAAGTFKLESSTALLGFLNDFNVVSEGISQQVEEMDNSFVKISETFGAMFGKLITDSASGAKAFRNFAISGIRAAIALAKVQVIANATGPNAANVASGGLSSPAFIIAGLTMLEGF